jgi:hypothetical protein
MDVNRGVEATEEDGRDGEERTEREEDEGVELAEKTRTRQWVSWACYASGGEEGRRNASSILTSLSCSRSLLLSSSSAYPSTGNMRCGIESEVRRVANILQSHPREEERKSARPSKLVSSSSSFVPPSLPYPPLTDLPAHTPSISLATMMTRPFPPPAEPMDARERETMELYACG